MPNGDASAQAIEFSIFLSKMYPGDDINKSVFGGNLGDFGR
jgi:hypothetical protein